MSAWGCCAAHVRVCKMGERGVFILGWLPPMVVCDDVPHDHLTMACAVGGHGEGL